MYFMIFTYFASMSDLSCTSTADSRNFDHKYLIIRFPKPNIVTQSWGSEFTNVETYINM